MSRKETLDKRVIDDMFNKQFEKLDNNDIQTDVRMETLNTLCQDRSRPINHSTFTQLAGFENLNTNTFHLKPERNNTYHNYNVLQETGSYCSMNHQIFMNNTKRNIGFINEEQRHVNIDDIIPGEKPMFHNMNNCMTSR